MKENKTTKQLCNLREILGTGYCRNFANDEYEGMCKEHGKAVFETRKEIREVSNQKKDPESK